MSLIDHWKIPKKKITIQNYKNYRTNKGLYTIEIKNKDLVPGWGNKRLKIWLNGFSREYKDADCNIISNKRPISLLSIEKKVMTNHLDRIIEDILLERYIKRKKPLFTKLPFDYTKIPPKVRVGLFNILLKFKKDPGFPEWPIDKSVETLRHVFIRSLPKTPYIRFWPNKKETAAIITHDCDSSSSFRTMDKVLEIEERYNFKSSWNFVPKKYKLNIKKIKELKRRGFEIGVHGYNHQGKMPFLPKRQAEIMIRDAKDILKDFDPKGFRSALLQRNEQFLNLLSQQFNYDSSVPDTDIYSPLAFRNGCSTVFPFMINNMVELPLTMPQEWRLIRMDMNTNRMLDLWKDKISYIRSVNGLININMHPDDFISGNDKYLNLYERLLKEISKIENAWTTLPNKAALWWEKRDKAEIKGDKIINLKGGSIDYT